MPAPSFHDELRQASQPQSRHHVERQKDGADVAIEHLGAQRHFRGEEHGKKYQAECAAPSDRGVERPPLAPRQHSGRDQTDEGARRGSEEIGHRIEERSRFFSRPSEEEVQAIVPGGMDADAAQHGVQSLRRRDPQRRPEPDHDGSRDQDPDSIRQEELPDLAFARGETDAPLR